MMWKELTLSPKGQVTLPKDMREELGIEPGDALVFTIVDNRIIVTPKSINFNDLAGFMGEPPAGRATLEEIDAAVMKAGGANALPPRDAARDAAA
jgi:antitoxin PrlF